MIKHKIEINSNVYSLAETFRNLVSFVFEELGKDSDETRFETFNDIGNFRKDSTSTGFFSFRNEDSFYWIFLKLTHSNNSGGSQKLSQEFEVQIKVKDVAVVQIYGESIEYDVSEIKPLSSLNFEYDENHFSFGQSFLSKIEDKIKVITYEPIAA